MRSFVLGALLPALTLAAPAVKRADASPTLMTFTLDGSLVTATYYGTATTANAACPTQTFTYEGVAITTPYTGPGTPQSCLTSNVAVPTETSEAVSATTTPSVDVTTTAGPGDGGPSVATSALVSPTTSATSAGASSTSSASSTIPKGFNYGSSGMTQSTYETQFALARDLVGTSGFTSARLYTSIQDGTTAGVISAIPAAIATKTQLLLGLFYPNVDNEIAALKAAIEQYGSDLADLVLGISVGSEDLYRDSAIGINSGGGTGASPDQLVSFIQTTRAAIAGTVLADKPIGHVDTWNSWTNSSNTAVVSAVDFLGTDAYPYFQNTYANDISNGASLFESAYQATVSVAGGKPVWITETGWPVSGPTENQALANVANAETYWQAVGCGFAFDKVPTFWYTVVDEGASPSFGVTDGTTTPLYNLACSS